MLVALFCLCSAISAHSQTPKFGHINVEEVVSLMTDRDSALVRRQRYVADLEQMYMDIQTEYRTKATDYQQKNATWTTAIRETKERELNDIMQRLEQFQQSAQDDIAQMNNILFGPVYTKANEAIQKVGKELGLIYVFNSTNLPYIDDSQSIDLLAKVKEELNIPAEKVAPTIMDDQAQR